MTQQLHLTDRLDNCGKLTKTNRWSAAIVEVKLMQKPKFVCVSKTFQCRVNISQTADNSQSKHL